MKRKIVDYRQFKLNTPQFSHLWLLLGWVVYFFLFFLTENFIPEEKCTVVHCFIDDIIPFYEGFIIPYVAWYLLIFGSLLYFLLYNVDNFKRLQNYIMITQAIALVIFCLFPTKQELRPVEFPRDNFLTDCVAYLYLVDTNTGVCPSLHCAFSIGIASMWIKEKSVSWWFKSFILFLAAMVCLSTMFLKQHSALDFFAALPLCAVAEYIACYKYWKSYKDKKKGNVKKRTAT